MEVETTNKDHDRVMAVPAYRRWYENSDAWRSKWQSRQWARAAKMRLKALEKYNAELQRISDWENQNVNTDKANEAWSKADHKRYWTLRKV